LTDFSRMVFPLSFHPLILLFVLFHKTSDLTSRDPLVSRTPLRLFSSAPWTFYVLAFSSGQDIRVMYMRPLLQRSAPSASEVADLLLFSPSWKDLRRFVKKLRASFFRAASCPALNTPTSNSSSILVLRYDDQAPSAPLRSPRPGGYLRPARGRGPVACLPLCVPFRLLFFHLQRPHALAKTPVPPAASSLKSA